MAAERDHDADLRSREQLIAELRSLCAARRSGTLFIITIENHPGQIVLRDGDVVALSYRLTRGPDALAPLTLFSAARYRFQQESAQAADPRLPPTAEILARLGAASGAVAPPYSASASDSRSAPDRTPVAGTGPAAEATPVADARTPADTRKDADPGPGLDAEAVGRVRPLIERELAEFLGPMAPVICDEHLAGLRGLGSPEIAELVAGIAREIGDPAKEARFTERVLSQISRG